MLLGGGWSGFGLPALSQAKPAAGLARIALWMSVVRVPWSAGSAGAADAGEEGWRRPDERRYHMHIPGVVFVGFSLVIALGAINSQNNLLFLALGLSLGALAVSGIVSGASLLGVRLARRVPTSAQCFRAMEITYSVRNANRIFPALGLSIGEELPRELRSRRTFGVAWWKFRFIGGEPLANRGRLPGAFVGAVGPRRTIRTRARVVPLRRGWMPLPRTAVWTTFPFGLSRKSVRFDQEARVLVRPGVVVLRPGLVAGLLTHLPHGDRDQSRAGLGEEFYGLREHAPGDAMRQIARRTTARRLSWGSTPVIRLNRAPAPRVYWLVVRLDAALQHAENERAIVLAASLASALIEARAAVGLVVHGAVLSAGEEAVGPAAADLGVTPRLEPHSGPTALHSILTLLARVTATGAGQANEVAPTGGAVIAIHAGPVDARAVAGAARHWSGQDLTRVAASGRSGEVLALLERSVQRGEGAFA